MHPSIHSIICFFQKDDQDDEPDVEEALETAVFPFTTEDINYLLGQSKTKPSIISPPSSSASFSGSIPFFCCSYGEQLRWTSQEGASNTGNEGSVDAIYLDSAVIVVKEQGEEGAKGEEEEDEEEY